MARLSIIKKGTTNYTLGATELVSVSGTTVTPFSAGSSVQPVYFYNGTPRVLYATVGSGSWPIYMYNGQLSECSEIDEGEGTW